MVLLCQIAVQCSAVQCSAVQCSAVQGGAYAHAAITCYTLSSFLVQSEQMMSQPAGQAFGGTACIDTSGGCTVHKQIHGYKMEQSI